MRAIIIGGGKVGGYLAQELRRSGRAVIVVEPDETRARRVGEQTGALVIVGDGTDLRLLEGLDIRPSDFVLAVTGVDEANLVACQLTRTTFGVTKVLARLNDPRNRHTFETLDIPVVSVTDLLVQVISHEMDLGELVRVAILGRGEVSLLEVEIPAGRPPRRVSDVTLPESSVLVAIRRDGTVVVPGGATMIEPGDRVLAVTLVELEDEVRDALTREADVADAETTPRLERPLTIDDAD